jgi:hypothetical protein
LLTEILANFQDPEFGFYDTHIDNEKLLLRIKNIQDNVTPSGNALAALALNQLAVYEGEIGWWCFYLWKFIWCIFLGLLKLAMRIIQVYHLYQTNCTAFSRSPK